MSIKNIKVISVGKIKDKSISEKIKDFAELIGHECKCYFVEIKDCSEKDFAANLAEEGRRIIEQMGKEKGYFCILSEEGKQLGSREFAAKLKKVSMDISGNIVFVIGGPFGLSDEVRRRGNEIISLSKMTFTHEMCKLFLLEQIYRAITIIQNKKYHHD